MSRSAPWRRSALSSLVDRIAFRNALGPGRVAANSELTSGARAKSRTMATESRVIDETVYAISSAGLDS